MTTGAARMRDEVIRLITRRMATNRRIFFLSADFGSPQMDALVSSFPDRFVNVGVAEQNLANIAAGMALEGCVVFAYAIAPFLSMRCYEQVRTNLAMLSQKRKMNVTLIGVGAGLSYDVSGPTHQAMEDISIMRTLPNVEVLSPCDFVSATALAARCILTNGIRYLRLDGKALPPVYPPSGRLDTANGFFELRRGRGVCLVSTGYMTHKALGVASILEKEKLPIGVVDIFSLSGPVAKRLTRILRSYETVMTIEEGFIGKGGLDSLIFNLVNDAGLGCRFGAAGLRHEYRFDPVPRDELLKLHGLDVTALASRVRKFLRRSGRGKL